MKYEAIQANCRYWSEIERLAKEAFPPEEYLPPAQLLRMAEAENFDFLALLDGDAFAGFLAVLTHGKLAYLFFLAIAPQYRGAGYGSRALAMLRERYPGYTQVVDFEMLEEGADNAAQRARRRAFYLRNGYRETGLFLSYFGVNYEVMEQGDGFCKAAFREMMQTLPIAGFAPTYFTR